MYDAGFMYNMIHAAEYTHIPNGHVPDNMVCIASVSRGDHSEAPACMVGLV